MLRRRDLVETCFYGALFNALFAVSAGATARGGAVSAWLNDIVALKDALKAGEINETDWQTLVERRHAQTPLSDIVQWLDLDRLAARFPYATRLAHFTDPALPAEITGAAGMDGWFFRVFGMRRDGGLLPHVHNTMVSAHIVLSGSFRVRTHDRLRDLKGAVLLRPVRDAILRPGDILTMSSTRENQHWLRALEDRSMTLDVGIYGVADARLALPAQFNSTILIDPTVRPERDGTIVAPVLSVRQAIAKFAAA